MNLVVKKHTNMFDVLTDGVTKTYTARNLRNDGIFVGDNVEVDENLGTITKVCERKNLLIRPPMANVDKIIIVIAKVPKPDFLLVDKLLIFCTVNDIEPLICVNKADLGEDFVKFVKDNYSMAANVVSISSLDSSAQILKEHIRGITALAGQSAVGKSSIINALLGQKRTEVGSLSKKVEKGKQTTRTVQLYDMGNNNFLADTSGFSLLDERLLKIDETELKSYYPEFLPLAAGCKYKSCAHMGKDCKVVEAVKNNKISRLRYENYLTLYENLKRLPKF